MKRHLISVVLLVAGYTLGVCWNAVAVEIPWKDGQGKVMVPDKGPCMLGYSILTDIRGESDAVSYYTYLGIDGAGHLMLQRVGSRERVDLSVGKQVRNGVWKVFLSTSVGVFELEVKDLGDSRVQVKLLNAPKQN